MKWLKFGKRIIIPRTSLNCHSSRFRSLFVYVNEALMSNFAHIQECGEIPIDFCPGILIDPCGCNIPEMTIPACGTFDYITVIPEGQILPNEQPWKLRVRDESAADPSSRAQLLGEAAVLNITDGGPTPDPNPWRPAVSRALFTLKATTRNSTARSASFFVDQYLVRYLVPGDYLHVVRTAMGDLGVSLIRGYDLIFALGAVSSVSLGRDIHVRTPWDLIQEMAAIVRTRDPQFGLSPISSTFRELPVEISIRGCSRILYSGEFATEQYKVWVDHGQVPGIDSARHEAVALWDKELCARATVIGSLQLIDDGLKIGEDK